VGLRRHTEIAHLLQHLVRNFYAIPTVFDSCVHATLKKSHAFEEPKLEYWQKKCQVAKRRESYWRAISERGPRQHAWHTRLHFHGVYVMYSCITVEPLVCSHSQTTCQATVLKKCSSGLPSGLIIFEQKLAY
jgi:hypothetical protein